jgi:hypothetical protein
MLGKVEEDSGANVRKIAATEGIGVPLVWRTLHEQSLNHTTSGEYRPSLILTAVQGRCFANGFSQNAL